MTITLPRTKKTRLQQKAAQTGQAADTLAESLLSDALLSDLTAAAKDKPLIFPPISADNRQCE